MICIKKLDLVLENQKKINRRLDKIEAEIDAGKTRKNNALHIKIWEIVLKKHHHP